MTFTARNTQTGELLQLEVSGENLISARLTVEDVAKIYKVDARTVQNWQGRIIDCMKLGRVIRFTPEALQKAEQDHPFLAERRQKNIL